MKSVKVPALELFLHEMIPLAKAMGVGVEVSDDRALVLCAPKEQNKNSLNTAFGGSLQTGIRIDRKDEGNLVEMRMVASDVDSGALAAAMDLTRMAPRGRANISVVLKGFGTGWNTVFQNAEGSVSTTFGQGGINGIDIDAFLRRSSANGFFPLFEVGEGALAFEKAELKAKVSKGIATIEKAEFTTPRRIISIGGIVPYVGRGLALSGTVSPATQNGAETGPEASFFIGGSWGAPFVLPVQPTVGGQRE